MSTPENRETPHHAGELVPKVYDADIVTGHSAAAPDRRPVPVVRRKVIECAGYLIGRVRGSGQVARWRGLIAYRARKLPRDLVRLLWFLLRGHGRWLHKGWTWVSYADLRSDVRRARMTGDAQARRQAQETLRADAKARWAKLGIGARRILVTAAAVVVVLVLLALTNMLFDRASMPSWLATVYDVRDVLGTALVVAARWLMVLGPLGWIVAAVWEGRDRAPGAGWLTQPDRTDADSWIDERMISRALAHLGIAPMNAFFKNGGELVYLTSARTDGDGTFARVRMPLGVTADMVTDRRPTLAANLGRSSLETWPTKGDEDGVLDLWVADKGTLQGGAGDWPLLHEGSVDVFDGVPFGLTQRGLIVNAPLLESNWLIGGRPGQGKTSALRTLLLGAALDPTAELQVYVMGESPDFEPLTPRLSRYRMGMDDSVAADAVAALRDLTEEMERRGRRLGAQPGQPPKVSRKLADRPGLGLHPLILAIDECHELFQHKKYGKQAAELAVRLIKRGRKYGIVLLLATQSPTKDSIPKEITRNISCGVAFAVADHVANDGLLGAGRYRAGIRATELRMTTDRGTCVAVGITNEPWELVRTYYVTFEDGTDHVTPVVARAMAIRAEHGQPVALTTGSENAPPAPVDHLADIAEVCGTEKRVRTQIVLARLIALDPDEYDGWTLPDLTAALADHGIAPVKSDGIMVIRTADVAGAIAAEAREADRDPAGSQGVLPNPSPTETPCPDQRKHRPGRRKQATQARPGNPRKQGQETTGPDSLPGGAR